MISLPTWGMSLMPATFVTNIPTPYRVSMFNSLLEAATKRGANFRVLFMNGTEPNRSWTIDDELNFPYEQWNIPIATVRGVYFRFSPSFVLKAVKENRHLILGGSWNDLNIMAIALLKRMCLIKNKISFWTEANYLTVGARRSSKAKQFVRRFILSSGDGYFFIPGEMSAITLEKWGVNCADRIVLLPNLPHLQFEENISTWKGSNSTFPVFTLVARLDEETKGIENLIECLGDERVRKIRLNIIGSGRDFSRYKKYIESRGLGGHVFLLGELPPKDVIRNLKSSDVFVLPSFSDPSPLSLVEACKIGLPLLVSDRCGNHHECVISGENGYLFDPSEAEQVALAFDQILANRSNWHNYSKSSVDLAARNFDPQAVLGRLAAYL